MAEVRGTFFSDGYPAVVHAFLHAGQAEIADDVERRIHLLQYESFRYESSPPTGYAARHIVNRDMSSQHVITDSGIVYGAWLEGVGSRNFPKTRFKGYSIFRRVTQTARPISLALPHIRKMCEAINR